MTRFGLLPFVAAVPCVAALATAAQVPKEGGTPISAGNAHRVRSVAEVPKRADRIIRGPKPGELVIQSSVRAAPNAWTDTAEVVDDTTFRTVRPLATRSPASLAVSPDGKFLAFTERGSKSYTVLEIAADKTLEIKTGDYPDGAAFSPDGRLLALGNQWWHPTSEGEGYAETKLYDLTGKLVRTLERSKPGTQRPVFSPDGKTLAVSNCNHEPRLFDVAAGKLRHALPTQSRLGTHEVAFSPDGRTLACGYVDGTVAVFDVATGTALHATKTAGGILSVDWSPRGDVLATCGLSGRIVLWEPGTLKKLAEWYAPAWVVQVRFAADGTRLLTSSAADQTGTKDRKIEVWAVPDPSDR